MPSRPPRPVGSSKWAIAAQDDWDYKYDPKRVIIRDTPQYTVDKNADGTMKLNLKPSKGGGAGGWDWQYPDHTELDPTLSYSAGKWAYISKLNPLAVAGMTDIVSNATVVSCEGYWLCVQNVPAAVGGKFNVPVWPPPVGAAVLGGGTFAIGTTAPSGTPLIGDMDLLDPTTGQKTMFWEYWGSVN